MPTLFRRLARPEVAFGLPLLLGSLITPASADESCTAESISWSSEEAFIEVGVGSPVLCSLDQIAALTPDFLLKIHEPGIYFLSSDLFIRNGSTVTIYGPEATGNGSELRILSSNAPGAARPFFEITADYGNLLIDSTKITSWDDLTGGPDEIWSNGRSFLSAKSKLDKSDPANPVPLESRMDLFNSDIGYLGYDAAESQGLAWKVNGKTATDFSVFEAVGVYGSILSNDIHHLYYGAYSYGGQDMEWINNVLRNNIKYGLALSEDSDNLWITDNDVHDNGDDGIVCAKRCDTLLMINNSSYNNDGHGIMLLSEVTDSQLILNVLYFNEGSGLALFNADNNAIQFNYFASNKTGILLSDGSDNNRLVGNTIQNNRYGYVTNRTREEYSEGDGRSRGNTVEDNTFRENSDNAVLLKQSEDHFFDYNTFENNGPITLQDSHNSVFTRPFVEGDKITVESENSTSQFIFFDSLLLKTRGESVTEIISGYGGLPELSRGKGIITLGEQERVILPIVPAMVGGYAEVNVRPVVVGLNKDSAEAYIKSWPEEADSPKEVWLRASTEGVEANITFAALLLNTTYRVVDVNRGVEVISMKSDGQGQVTFSAPLAKGVIEKFRLELP